MPSPITTKAEMYSRLNAGLLGHTLPAAETIEDFERLSARAAPDANWVCRFKTAGAKTVFNISTAEALVLVRSLPDGTWNLSVMLSDPHRLCYGHLWDGVGGWYLHYSDEPKPCSLKQYRDGCEQQTKQGLAARLYIRGLCDDIGWETILALVEQYPDHCIEFTVMASSVYAMGPTSLIVWEVRCLTSAYEVGSEWGQ